LYKTGHIKQALSGFGGSRLKNAENYLVKIKIPVTIFEPMRPFSTGHGFQPIDSREATINTYDQQTAMIHTGTMEYG
jgi:hypothetical protein